jgi:hypothetical protein
VIVLADNDVIAKLSLCDLAAEFYAAFNVVASEVFVLPAARFVLLPKKNRPRYEPEVCERLNAFFASASVITDAPTAAVQQALAETHNIDAGEALLYAAAHERPGSIVVSDDKRCIEALAAAPNPTCAAIAAAIAGRVHCFAMIALRIIDHAGFATVRERLIIGGRHDIALGNVVGSELDFDEAKARFGFQSYLRDLRSRSGSLLASYP